MQLEELLGSTFIARGLEPQELSALAACCEIKNFEAGETIIREFEKSHDVMIVLEGTVRVKTFSSDQLVDLGPASVFGEVALVDENPRSATVVAVGPVKLAVIDGSKLKTLMSGKPHLGYKIMSNLATILAQRLRLATVRLDAVTRQ